jgi:hypothetical protein
MTKGKTQGAKNKVCKPHGASFYLTRKIILSMKKLSLSTQFRNFLMPDLVGFLKSTMLGHGQSGQAHVLGIGLKKNPGPI